MVLRPLEIVYYFSAGTDFFLDVRVVGPRAEKVKTPMPNMFLLLANKIIDIRDEMGIKESTRFANVWI